jgi:hypothetical protein
MLLQTASAVRPCLVSWNLGEVTGVVSKTDSTRSGVEQPRNFRQESGKSLSLGFGSNIEFVRRFISVMKSLVVVAPPSSAKRSNRR